MSTALLKALNDCMNLIEGFYSLFIRPSKFNNFCFSKFFGNKKGFFSHPGDKKKTVERSFSFVTFRL